MNEIDTLECEIAQAEEVKKILESVYFKETFQKLHDGFMDQWNSSDKEDKEGRERIWLAVRMLQNIKAAMEHHLETGEMAKIQLATKTSPMKKLLSAWR